MARPREFDRETALQNAIDVFWSKGYAAASTDDLLQKMQIGRQSLYNAFGDKRQLYLEALAAYQRRSTSEHLRRLTAPTSPLAGVRDLLVGLVLDDDALRGLGCMGVGSVNEFGATDQDLLAMREKVGAVIQERVIARVREGQEIGEIDASLDPDQTAGFVLLTMTGLQIAARAGAGADDLRELATFSVDRLRAK